MLLAGWKKGILMRATCGGTVDKANNHLITGMPWYAGVSIKINHVAYENT